MSEPDDASHAEPAVFRALANTLFRAAAVFERSATLADEHADRMEKRGEHDMARRERRHAAKARDAVTRCRERAAYLAERYANETHSDP